MRDGVHNGNGVPSPQESPTPVYCDNDAVRQLAMTGRITQQNKHIDLKCCILKWWVDERIMDVIRIDSDCNIADIGTKIMQDAEAFRSLRNQLVRAGNI